MSRPAKLTPKALGLSRIGTGLGPRDYAYAGHGYRIAPVTNRYWRLSTVGGKQIATASTCADLLIELDELLRSTPDLDHHANPNREETDEDHPTGPRTH
ncbi:hypothetical protein [Amycolatopsis sp. lyj-108]|uniref:hypothetical protein n=1 Tax=Amycolatopsis sp. lyj-108 TaxID=2789286 RepID=UPI00397ACC7D